MGHGGKNGARKGKITLQMFDSALPFIDVLPYPVFRIDENYRVRYANQSARAVYGEGHDTCHRLTHGYEKPCHNVGEPCPKIEADQSGLPAFVTHSHTTEHGNQLFAVLATPMEDGDVVEFHIELTDSVCRDVLTQMYARPFFEQLVQRELALLERMRLSYALIFFDLDRFKRINDDNGHKAGDAALRAVGRIVQHTLRDSDLAGRWGGEEFCIFLPGSDSKKALQVAERLRMAIRNIRLEQPWTDLRITASLGIYASADSFDFERAIRGADIAMYSAKENGRDRIETANVENATAAVRRIPS